MQNLEGAENLRFKRCRSPPTARWWQRAPARPPSALRLPTSSRSRSRENVRSARSVGLCRSRSTARRAGADANPNAHATQPAPPPRTLTYEQSSTHALTRVQVRARTQRIHARTNAHARAGVDVLHGHGRGAGARHRPASQRSSAAMPSDADRSGSHGRVGACNASARHPIQHRSLSNAIGDDRRLLARVLCRLMPSSLPTLRSRCTADGRDSIALQCKR